MPVLFFQIPAGPPSPGFRDGDRVEISGAVTVLSGIGLCDANTDGVEVIDR